METTAPILLSNNQFSKRYSRGKSKNNSGAQKPYNLDTIKPIFTLSQYGTNQNDYNNLLNKLELIYRIIKKHPQFVEFEWTTKNTIQDLSNHLLGFLNNITPEGFETYIDEYSIFFVKEVDRDYDVYTLEAENVYQFKQTDPVLYKTILITLKAIGFFDWTKGHQSYFINDPQNLLEHFTETYDGQEESEIEENNQRIKEIMDCVEFHETGAPSDFIKDLYNIEFPKDYTMKYRTKCKNKKKLFDTCKKIINNYSGCSLTNYMLPFCDIYEFNELGRFEDTFTLTWSNNTPVYQSLEETLDSYGNHSGYMPLHHYSSWQEDETEFPLPIVTALPTELLKLVANLIDNLTWEK
jgi:hypothetical protein